ncbi:hypothetical protein WNY98_01010 [Pseudoalteromonas sp. AS71]|uniref:hypothetical protein n=1 Tax=Pseudoalteromonas sp. AS71 TaxID=3135777 RepID=UPI00316D8249
MKFEFGDLYKFIVSLGVVLITLSVTTPWLFLREPFDLYKTHAEIQAFTPVAQDIIQKRQSLISFIFTFIPWFSSIAAIVGMIFIYMGLQKWQVNQSHLDKQTMIESKLKENALRESTQDEIEYKQSKETEGLVQFNTSPKHLASFRRAYYQIETCVFNRLNNTYSNKYKVSHNMMIAGFELDIFLEGKSLLTKNYIIEVKYIRKGFNFGWLNEAFLRNLYAQNAYSKITNKAANTLLLIVIADEAYNEDKYSKLLTRLRSNELYRKGKDIVRIITETELNNVTDIELQEKLNINA